MNPQGSSFVTNLIPIVLIFGIFYFLIMRPQQKQEKERQKMLAALSKGDKVLTSGGIIGVVAAINTDEVELKIAENVKIKVVRSAVVSVFSQSAQAVTPPAVQS